MLDDPAHLIFVHIGQRQIISEQKRQPIVFILDVQGTAHIFRILMYETKDALVLACQRLDRLEFQAERVPLSPDESNGAVLRLNCGAAADNGCLELEINNICEQPAIQFAYLVPGLQSNAIGKPARLDRQYAQRLTFSTPMRGRITIFVHSLMDIGRR